MERIAFSIAPWRSPVARADRRRALRYRHKFGR